MDSDGESTEVQKWGLGALNSQLTDPALVGNHGSIHSEVLVNYTPAIVSFSRSNMSLSRRLDSSPIYVTNGVFSIDIG